MTGETAQKMRILRSLEGLMFSNPTVIVPTPINAATTVCVADNGIPNPEATMMKIVERINTESIATLCSIPERVSKLRITPSAKLDVTLPEQNLAPINSKIDPITMA